MLRLESISRARDRPPQREYLFFSQRPWSSHDHSLAMRSFFLATVGPLPPRRTSTPGRLQTADLAAQHDLKLTGARVHLVALNGVTNIFGVPVGSQRIVNRILFTFREEIEGKD